MRFIILLKFKLKLCTCQKCKQLSKLPEIQNPCQQMVKQLIIPVCSVYIFSFLFLSYNLILLSHPVACIQVLLGKDLFTPVTFPKHRNLGEGEMNIEQKQGNIMQILRFYHGQ